jgi:hypothetical protein
VGDPPEVPEDDASGHLMRGFDLAPALPGAATDGAPGDPDEAGGPDEGADLAVDARPAGLAEFAAGDRWLFSIALPGTAPAPLPWSAELPGAPLDEPAGPPDPGDPAGGPAGGPTVRLADLDRSADGAGPPVPLDEPGA